MQSYKNSDVIIILDRLRSAHNVGNIFRIADSVGATQVITCGYTVTPPNKKLEKTAMGSDKFVATEHFEQLSDAVKSVRDKGVKMVLAIDTYANAVCAWEKSYEYPLAIILGNEALGVDQEIIKECDGVVDLPMLGGKASINVGNCAAVVMYSIVADKKRKNILNINE